MPDGGVRRAPICRESELAGARLLAGPRRARPFPRHMPSPRPNSRSARLLKRSAHRPPAGCASPLPAPARSRPLPLPGGLDQAGRALSRGASGPGQPAPSPPTHSTRSAYAAVKNKLRTTARPKPLIKNQNFAEGLSDQVRRLSAGLRLAHLNSSADVGIGPDRISSDHAYRPTAGAGGALTAVDPTPTRLRKTAK